MTKFTFNEITQEWERVDRTQEYKGVIIETLTTHGDYFRAPHRREYRLTYPSGRIGYIGINKRGGNIKTIKASIDIKTKYNELV